MMSDKITGAMKKEINERLKVLPREYQVVFYEISKYLWQFASTEAGVPAIQMDILAMLETGAQERKDVFEIVGNDVIGFCDGLLGEIPEHTWIGRMKLSMNQSIHKKLGRRMNDGK